jgi:hypothetical protein
VCELLLAQSFGLPLFAEAVTGDVHFFRLVRRTGCLLSGAALSAPVVLRAACGAALKLN